MKLNRDRKGFALPTVLITSIVMMIVLLAALSAATSIQASLNQQYYERMARNAAESGAIYAEKCLLSGSYSEEVPIGPDTDCNGSDNGQGAHVVDDGSIKTTFNFTVSKIDDRIAIVKIVGNVSVYGTSGGNIARTFVNQLNQRFSLEQNETEVRATQARWHFGRRLAFNFGTEGNNLEIIYNDILDQDGDQAYAGEGSTTINDADGNLLFWSNGRNIRDKAGQSMLGSYGLLGHRSATQAVVAFPLDDEYRKFGLISNTAAGEDSTPAGELYYSVVDMQLNSGNGDIVSGMRNIPLSTTNEQGYSSEALGAIPSDKPGEVWVYTYHRTNRTITRFRVGANGTIEEPPKITLNPAAPACQNVLGFGTFNFTDDYRKMLLLVGSTLCSSSSHGVPDETNGRAYIYRTNTQSGDLVLESSWVTAAASGPYKGSGYSADFSPAEDYVYVTQIYPGQLTRYDIRNGDSVAIKNSESVLATTLTSAPEYSNPSLDVDYQSGGQIKRAPNDKMYIADQAYNYGMNTGEYSRTDDVCKMSVINEPDHPDPNSIDLRIGGVVLPNGQSCTVFGLPQVTTIYKPKVILY